MTTLEAHKLFKIEVDKNAIGIGISGSPSFVAREIDHFLNSALISLISNKFTGNNALQAPFESMVKRVEDLEKLVKTDKQLSLLIDADTNRLILSNYTNSGNRMLYVSSMLRFGSGKLANVRLLSHDSVKRFIETHDNLPWVPEPAATIENDNMHIYYDRVDMVAPFTLDLTYIGYPLLFRSDSPDAPMSDLPEHMYREVITKAANSAIENIESPRGQTHAAQVQSAE